MEDLEKLNEIKQDEVKKVKVKQNMVRDRAKSSDIITDEQWALVDESTRYFYDEFFKINSTLSPDTLMQYRSALKIFFYYIYEYCNNKKIWQIKKTDFLKYVGWLDSRGMSSSGQKVKRYAVSSFCNTMEIVAEETEDYDKYPEMKNFKHFARVKIVIDPNTTYEKIPLTKEEVDLIARKLEEQGEIYALCYLMIGFNIGARRGEMLQLKSEIADYVKEEGKEYYISHNIRLKGKGKVGKVEKFIINDEAMSYIQKLRDWKNNDDELLFQNSNKNKFSRTWVNEIFSEKISPIIGRRVTSHNMKNSCATYLLSQGNDLKIVSKYILHHNDVSTSSKYYDLRKDDEAINKLF